MIINPPPFGHQAANFGNLPSQIGLLGASDIPTTGLLGPFTPMNIPNYAVDLPSSGFDVTDYVQKYYDDKAAKDASKKTGVQVRGELETYVLPSGKTTTDWAEYEHEKMYPGSRAAANAAGFRFLGATRTFNPAYDVRQGKILAMAKKLNPNLKDKYFSKDWKGVVKDVAEDLSIDAKDITSAQINKAIKDY